MKEQTRIIRDIWSDRENTPATTVNPPLYKGSTVLFDSYEDMAQAGRREYDGIIYGTDRLPTQRHFEEAIRKLEGGAVTRVFQSGIAAIQTVLMAFTKSGDHILVCDNAYGPGQNIPPSHAPVIPNFLRQAVGGGTLVVHKDGSQTRDYVYVEDVVNA